MQKTIVENDMTDEVVDLTDEEVAEILDNMTPEEFEAFQAEVEAEEQVEEDRQAVEDASQDPEGLDEDTRARVDLVAELIEATVTMTTLELADFTKRVLPMLGKEASVIPDGAAAKNKKSIDAKGDAKKAMKEQVETLFADDSLTDEFRTNAIAVFEAAVGAATNEAVAEAMVEAKASFAKAFRALQEQHTAAVESFLDELALKWLADNEVAVESMTRVNVADALLEDIKSLVLNYGIDFGDQEGLADQMAARIDELEGRLDEVINHAIEQQKVLVSYRRDELVAEAVKGMNALQAEKFKKLAEGLSYDDDEEFTQKLAEVKATISEGAKPAVKKPQSPEAMATLSESNQSAEGTDVEEVSPRMQSYLAALRRTQHA